MRLSWLLDRWRAIRPSGDLSGGPSDPLLAHATAPDRQIVEGVLPYSMTGAARLLALVDAVRYCIARAIPGAFVECGVWRGGSVLAMILTLQELGIADRDIYLYDTFEGMTAPTEADISDLEGSALEEWRRAAGTNTRPWNEVFGRDVFSEESVRSLLLGTGYPEARLHLVRGRVEETLPARAPDELALLRLDTDWYQSTRHELVHLFPRLSKSGVLIVDDYGHWRGARQAVDEYLASQRLQLLLARVDYSARLAIKQ
jgi:hypothetical protein